MSALLRVRHLVGGAVHAIQFRGDRRRFKEHEELRYWRSQKRSLGELTGTHYEYFFTDHFGLDHEFYAGARLLDIGCGPRGSLEWASMVEERIGLDPLAGAYREFGIDSQDMTYIESRAESIPFADAYFDVVSSFNSLDHVDDLEGTISEIKRVLRPAGTFLLLTNVNHDPTPTEPIEFSWDIVERFAPELTPTDVGHYEMSASGVYQSVQAAVPYDHRDANRRYGVLSAQFVKGSPSP